MLLDMFYIVVNSHIFIVVSIYCVLGENLTEMLFVCLFV